MVGATWKDRSTGAPRPSQINAYGVMHSIKEDHPTIYKALPSTSLRRLFEMLRDDGVRHFGIEWKNHRAILNGFQYGNNKPWHLFFEQVHERGRREGVEVTPLEDTIEAKQLTYLNAIAERLGREWNGVTNPIPLIRDSENQSLIIDAHSLSKANMGYIADLFIRYIIDVKSIPNFEPDEKKVIIGEIEDALLYARSLAMGAKAKSMGIQNVVAGLYHAMDLGLSGELVKPVMHEMVLANEDTPGNYQLLLSANTQMELNMANSGAVQRKMSYLNNVDLIRSVMG